MFSVGFKSEGRVVWMLNLTFQATEAALPHHRQLRPARGAVSVDQLVPVRRGQGQLDPEEGADQRDLDGETAGTLLQEADIGVRDHVGPVHSQIQGNQEE
jgi:hypothetical protein